MKFGSIFVYCWRNLTHNAGLISDLAESLARAWVIVLQWRQVCKFQFSISVTLIKFICWIVGAIRDAVDSLAYTRKRNSNNNNNNKWIWRHKKKTHTTISLINFEQNNWKWQWKGKKKWVKSANRSIDWIKSAHFYYPWAQRVCLRHKQRYFLFGSEWNNSNNNNTKITRVPIRK